MMIKSSGFFALILSVAAVDVLAAGISLNPVIPAMVLADENCVPIPGVSASTREGTLIQKAVELGDHDYCVIRPNGSMRVEGTGVIYKVVEEEVEGVEEVPEPEPEPEPSNPSVPSGDAYPQPAITYKPSIRSQPFIGGACSDIPTPAHVVTLADNQTLSSAYDSLLQKSPSGGVIEIKWDTKLVQCDSLRIVKDFPLQLVLRGIPGPDGELPRFYCRSDKINGGTVPNEQVTGVWLEAINPKAQMIVENLHIDGYKKQVRTGTSGHMILRSNYLHHATQDGISNSNTGGGTRNPYNGIEGPSRFHLEMCGNEIAHSGQGNFKHNTYMHRSLGGVGDHPELTVGGPGLHDTWSKVTYVSNLCHSPRWASCFKSIANENIIVGNEFHARLVTDPSYDMAGMVAQMLIDVANCSQNVIRENRLYAWKDSAEQPTAGGGVIIGIRGRKTAMRGCDVPMMWHPYENGIQPPAIDGPAHTEEFWTNLGGKIFFKTIVEDNYIQAVGLYTRRLSGIQVSGTYPAYDSHNRRCMLPTPMTWYERSRVYLNRNTWVGLTADQVYESNPGGHNGKWCWGYEDTIPPGPGPSSDLMEIGPDEIIIGVQNADPDM